MKIFGARQGYGLNMSRKDISKDNIRITKAERNNKEYYTLELYSEDYDSKVFVVHFNERTLRLLNDTIKNALENN